MHTSSRILLLLSLTSALAACGGGGGDTAPTFTGGGTATNSGDLTLIGGIQTVGVNPVADPPPDTSMSMNCVDGASVQCSGNTVLRVDNQVALTSSGVQVYGKSTNDLAPVIANTGLAIGMMPASGGIAEIRVTKNANGVPSSPALMLRNIGISWDTQTDRPPIIETFRTSQGRVAQDASGRIISGPLPDPSNLEFYDYAVKGRAATQSRYANNTYFPRDLTVYPVRCPDNAPGCRTTETDGFNTAQGNWRIGGSEPDTSTVFRLHADGDLYAGDGLPTASGQRQFLPRGDGFGVSYPGFKGYRNLDLWTMQYANLAAWYTMDTVEIVEFSGGSNEHNKGRRGTVAFGQVTDSAAVPGTGTASYAGVVYGWYAPNATDESVFFRGDANIVVNFATRQAQVTVQNTVTYNDARTPVPATLTSTMTWTPPANANYMTSAVGGAMPGGISARFFGPVNGGGPVETAGSFMLNNAGTGQTVVAGFIARKL